MDRVISHGAARVIAELWQEPFEPDFPLTRFARTGEITDALRRVVMVDLEIFELAAALGGHADGLGRRHLRRLLDYLEHHGERSPMPGWQVLPANDLRAVVGGSGGGRGAPPVHRTVRRASSRTPETALR